MLQRQMSYGHLAHRRRRKPCKVAILTHYRTGHKSIDSLRLYERPGLEQHWEACEALADISNKQVVPKRSTFGHQNILAPTIHCPTFPPAQFANSGTPVLPPSFTFSGCSVNVFTGSVMTSGTFQTSSTSFGLSQTDKDDFSKFDSFVLKPLMYTVYIDGMKPFLY